MSYLSDLHSKLCKQTNVMDLFRVMQSLTLGKELVDTTDWTKKIALTDEQGYLYVGIDMAGELQELTFKAQDFGDLEPHLRHFLNEEALKEVQATIKSPKMSRFRYGTVAHEVYGEQEFLFFWVS